MGLQESISAKAEVNDYLLRMAQRQEGYIIKKEIRSLSIYVICRSAQLMAERIRSMLRNADLRGSPTSLNMLAMTSQR